MPQGNTASKIGLRLSKTRSFQRNRKKTDRNNAYEQNTHTEKH